MNNEEQQEPNRSPKRIQLEDARFFSREGFEGRVYDDSNSNFNALGVEVHGSHPRKRMLGDTTRNYLVIDGTGKFIIDSETFDVMPGDLLVIPPGCEYQYEGRMNLFEFNVSPSGNIQDETL